MAVKIFQPSVYKEEIKQLLRDGVTAEECATRFPLTVRTIYNYLKEVQDEKAGKAPPGKQTTVPVVAVPGVAQEAFTPVGTPTPPPPEPPTREWMYIGPMRMPVEDWGYSSTHALLVVSDTFDLAKREYNFPQTMKVGDFLAELCDAFRLMRGWDIIGAGVYPVKIVNEKEVEVK